MSDQEHNTMSQPGLIYIHVHVHLIETWEKHQFCYKITIHKKHKTIENKTDKYMPAMWEYCMRRALGD